MKFVLAKLTFLGLLLGAGLCVIHGQDVEPPKIEVKTESIDPFDLKFRRPPSALEVDLNLLSKNDIDPSTAALIEYFRKRSLPDADRKRVAALVTQLGASNFRVREKATDELLALGPPALEFLRKGTAADDLELIRRAEKCGERIRGSEPRPEVTAAAVRVLARSHPSELAAVLIGYLPYTDSEYVADTIRMSLRNANRRDGRLHLELVAALKDELSVRRAAAGVALANVKEHKEAVRALLKDEDALVRFRVAEALVAANDKAAVTALIESLPLVSAAQGWSGEDLLLRMASGRNPPTVPRLGDAATRKKYVESWSDWWAKNERSVNLANLHDVPESLGHTVVILLDDGCVMELNARNEKVWAIPGLNFPLDVQVLGNGCVLVAEHHGNRVTERDRHGGIRWEKSVNNPLMAQRLPNRNTFVATDSQLFEFDETGAEVMSIVAPPGEKFLKVSKLPDGDIIALTDNSRFVRMNDRGKELNTFLVNMGARLYGGRLYPLPNGHVLIPHHSENLVCECDERGRIVWSVTVPEPVAAMRLPNGNTLVTTMNQRTGAMEFDPKGRPTDWSYVSPTSRVTRALRR